MHHLAGIGDLRYLPCLLTEANLIKASNREPIEHPRSCDYLGGGYYSGSANSNDPHVEGIHRGTCRVGQVRDQRSHRSSGSGGVNLDGHERRAVAAED